MKKGYKECPYCGEEIKEVAKKCRFCGEFLENIGENSTNNFNGKHQSKSSEIYAENNFARYCFDEDGFDGNGYDKNGYDKDGYDGNGYNKDGYDRNGYNKDGYDKNGYDKSGYNEDGYNKYGYDRNGYNEDGYDKNGYDKSGHEKVKGRKRLLLLIPNIVILYCILVFFWIGIGTLFYIFNPSDLFYKSTIYTNVYSSYLLLATIIICIIMAIISSTKNFYSLSRKLILWCFVGTLIIYYNVDHNYNKHYKEEFQRLEFEWREYQCRQMGYSSCLRKTIDTVKNITDK